MIIKLPSMNWQGLTGSLEYPKQFSVQFYIVQLWYELLLVIGNKIIFGYEWINKPDLKKTETGKIISVN